jgi:hypothetical protein
MPQSSQSPLTICPSINDVTVLSVEEPLDEFYANLLAEAVPQLARLETSRRMAFYRGYQLCMAYAKDTINARRPSFWNAAGGATGTFVWMLFYYGFTQFKQNVPLSLPVKSVLYGVNSVAQGYFANLAARPFIKRACMSEGDSEGDADRDSKKYHITYFPVDAQFQPNLDLALFLVQYFSKSIVDFVQEGDTGFTPAEIGLVAAITFLLTCHTHMAMSKLTFGHVDFMESYFKIFFLTMTFYFTDYLFDVEVKPGPQLLTHTIPNLFGSLAMMATSYVALDIAADKLEALKNDCSKKPASESDVADEEVESPRYHAMTL